MLSVTTSTTSKNIDKIVVIIRIYIAIIFVWLTFLTWFLWDIWYEKTCKYHPPISLDVTYELNEDERELVQLPQSGSTHQCLFALWCTDYGCTVTQVWFSFKLINSLESDLSPESGCSVIVWHNWSGSKNVFSF